MKGNPIHWRNRQHAERVRLELAATQDVEEEMPQERSLEQPHALPEAETVTLPTILEKPWMSPEALELKRRTPVFTS